MHVQITPPMIIGAFIIGLFSAYLAYKRQRNPYLWFALGFCFGIFGIFAIFFFPKKKQLPSKGKLQEPALFIYGPTEKFWYYLDPSHQSQGPMSHDALTRAWKEGKVTPSTYVWHEEMPEWKPLKETLKVEQN